MALLLLLLGPTLMIFLGLQVMSSVPLTFLLFYGWLMVVPFGERLFLKKRTLPDTFQHVGLVMNRKNVLLGFCLGILFFLTIILSGYFFHRFLFDLTTLQQTLAKWHFSGNLLIWLILVLILINPFLEEIYWRGYLYQKLEGKMPPAAIILLTSLCYSAYHLLSVIPLFTWPFNVVAVLPVFFAGLIWGYMRHRSKSLAGSILCHLLADGGIMAVYLFFLK